MDPGDAVDRTIRNQRYRFWPGLLAIVGWVSAWMPVALVIELETPYNWRIAVYPATLLLIVVSWVPLMVFLGRQPVRTSRSPEPEIANRMTVCECDGYRPRRARTRSPG